MVDNLKKEEENRPCQEDTKGSDKARDGHKFHFWIFDICFWN